MRRRLDFGSASCAASASTAEDVGNTVECGGQAGCDGRDDGVQDATDGREDGMQQPGDSRDDAVQTRSYSSHDGEFEAGMIGIAKLS